MTQQRPPDEGQVNPRQAAFSSEMEETDVSEREGRSELRDAWPDQQTRVQVSVGNCGCALGRGSSHLPYQQRACCWLWKGGFMGKG